MSRTKVEFSQASKDTYKIFCEENPSLKISFVDYANIIYSFNYGFRDHLYETGNKGKLPYLGDFVVAKYKPKTTRLLSDSPEDKKTHIPVDWKKTKEAGHYIYHLNLHTDGWKYKIMWMIKSLRFQFSFIWLFKPCRVTSRTLRHYVNQPEYCDKYLRWRNK